MNHEVEVSNLMFNKTSNNPIDFKKYDINLELEEESSNDEKTILKYSLDLTSNPKNAVINITGNTILSGEQSEIEEFLKQEEEKPPEVVSLIYQELFPLMYIISKNMKIPSPAHTISQNNIKQIESQEDKKEILNKETLETKSEEIKEEQINLDQPMKEPKEKNTDHKEDTLDQTITDSPEDEINNIDKSGEDEKQINENESS